MTLPASIPINLESADTLAQREALVAVFGQHLFALRNRRIAAICRRILDDEARLQLGAIHRREFDAIAALGSEGKQAGMALAAKSIDAFIHDLLDLLGHTGDDLTLTDGSHANCELILRIRSSDRAYDQRINSETKGFLGSYFGKWLNEYASHLEDICKE